ncbi:putative protease [Sporobacter termitidis DSM 10068]|uniref:Putative protease n=1 Tax=Sporobacter termitidis DSM 10068 TaxID=1123282 RepID=A0A1M5YMP9_9FIRM|nr:U32 family peptidase [Sporobacter termitidis]SHI13188.1 putative protease [Sporobacter termitidis DSM 10068]
MADKPELLSPAGDIERLNVALTYGADAVYLAGPRFGMRAAAGNFSDEDMEKAAALCHGRGVRVYVTCNTVMRGEGIAALPQYFERLQAAGADAVIVTDLGAFTLAKKYAPKLKIHISTQAGIMNAESARAFYDLGASRVVLARELTLEEIAEIRAKTPAALELEAFVHGSMCVAFSGRCLLSNYLAGRDANSGACAQPCRWKYRLIEEKRPDDWLEISEEGGTYVFNSRDLCMIDHLPELLEAGVTSLKIEGRTKSAYYAAAVTNAYRHALDAALQGIALPRVWSEEVNKVSHREYSTGFYFGREGPGQYYKDSMYFSDCDVAAVVESCDGEGNAVLTQRNRFFAGDTLELLTPGGVPETFTAGPMLDAEGLEITAAPHPMMTLRMRLPGIAPQYSILRKPRQAELA